MTPELPVIYENPRFDAATPTLKPVVDRAIRFSAILMLEWGTLTIIEDSPRYLKFATVIIAVLILAVHESWPWLRMRNRRSYPILMSALVLGYAGIFAYAVLTETHVPRTQSNAGAFAEASVNAPKAPPNPETELAFGPYVASDIERMIPIFIALNDTLTKDATPQFDAAQQITQNWQVQFHNMGVSPYIEKLKAISSQMIAARAAVYKIVSDNGVYRNETDTAVRDGPNNVDAFAVLVSYFVDNSDAVSALPETQQFRVLGKDVQRLQAAANGYNDWVQKSIERVRTKIGRLRDYKP